MTRWTLRQQRIYDGYGNHPQAHSSARRAVRQVRRHALEFHGAGMVEATAALTVDNPFTSADVHDVVAQIQAAFQAFRVPQFPALSSDMTTVEMVNLAKDAGETDG